MEVTPVVGHVACFRHHLIQMVAAGLISGAIVDDHALTLAYLLGDLLQLR